MKHIKHYVSESREDFALYQLAEEIATKLHCDRVGNCVHFAELFVLKVAEMAPELLDRFIVVEGWVDWQHDDGVPQQHTWIELKDGEKIDPTFEQFTKWGWARYSKKRARKFSGVEYYKDTVEGTWFGERRERFPEMVFKSTP
jgi:hypothetical protein